MKFYGKDGIRLEGPETNRDYFELNNVTYQALPLIAEDEDVGHGINSTVLRAKDTDDSEAVLKICNFPIEWAGDRVTKRKRRFSREIRALKMASRSANAHLVVGIYCDAILQIGNLRFQCYLMEKAEGTLKDFLITEQDISLQQRMLLCWNLLQSFHALHKAGIYHRDIKPENIFNVCGSWKVGDLGLVTLRGEDETIDGAKEKIGPIKWMSPEAVNKAYARVSPKHSFIDCVIDDRSDVYQLGKLFWFILQGDIPNGCLQSRDLVVAGEDVYRTLLRPLLSYRKSERPHIEDLITSLEPARRQYGF